jgi:hypothetical protein
VATETLVYPDPPTLTNGNDGNQDYNLGIRFSVDEAKPCIGVRWVRTPDSVAATPNGGTWVAAIWTVVGETRIAFKNFTPPAATDDFDILFDPGDEVVLDPLPTLYVVSIFTRDYTFRASFGGSEIFSPSGMMQADEGRLAASGNPLSYPASVQASHYYLSPIIEISGDPETSGTAGLTIGASAVTGASKPTSGAGALTVAGSAAVATSRLTSGTAALTATATAAGSSSRTTTGRAELAAGASAALSSARVTSGAARVLFDASATQVRGGGGPRLVTVGRASRLTSVTRPSAISTSTRG